MLHVCPLDYLTAVNRHQEDICFPPPSPSTDGIILLDTAYNWRTAHVNVLIFLESIDPDDQGISTTTVDSWEDNWLFQKKRVSHPSSSNNYHHHPVPVPMLVPNPCEVTRPLIGDRDADETSELSDYSNSALDELLELCKLLIWYVYIIVMSKCRNLSYTIKKLKSVKILKTIENFKNTFE